MYFYRIDSNKVYKKVSSQAGGVVVSRIGDNKRYTLDENAFATRYQAVPEEKIPSIEQYNQREPMTLGAPDAAAQTGDVLNYKEAKGFSSLVLSKEIQESLESGIQTTLNYDDIQKKWDLDALGFTRKTAINLYGPPGTGKTASVMALAKKIKKDVLRVDYSAMISKWVGDTGKNIKQAFEEAKKNDYILLFDEADSMLSKRVELSGDSTSNSANQNRNILMQELDKFEGVVFFTTNFFQNYDKAINRRILSHIEYALPNQSQRAKIFKKLMPKQNNLTKEDFLEIAVKSIGVSGGDVRNVIINTVLSCESKKEDLISKDVVLKEVTKALGSKTNSL